MPSAFARGTLRRRWLLAVTVGELAGFSVPAVIGAAGYAAGLDGGGLLPLLVVAGAGEGAVLGYAQARVLTEPLPELSRRDWIAATSAAGAFAWLLGMLPSTLHDRLEDVPLAIVIPAGAVIAGTLLLSIGAAQWLVLRRHVPRASRWIPANGLGWLAGLPIPFLLLGAASSAGPVAQIAAGIVAGGAMGAAVALVTGEELVRLLRPERGRRRKRVVAANGRAAYERAYSSAERASNSKPTKVSSPTTQAS